jgi:uncharacterized protein YndB with AHSA1/START domain
VLIRHSLDIDAPIEKVFALVDDPERIKLWMKGLEETVYPTPPNRENPVGTRFKQRIREGRRVAEYDGEVTAYDKPTHLAVRIGNEKFLFDVDYRLSDLGGRTQLDYTAQTATEGGLRGGRERPVRLARRPHRRQADEAPEEARREGRLGRSPPGASQGPPLHPLTAGLVGLHVAGTPPVETPP